MKHTLCIALLSLPLLAYAGPIKQNEYCLEIPEARFESGSRITLMSCVDANPSQDFVYAYKEFISFKKQCLTVQGNISAGQAVQLETCQGARNQKFSMDKLEGPMSSSIKTINGLCLDSHGRYNDRTSTLTVETCTHQENQQFELNVNPKIDLFAREQRQSKTTTRQD